MPLYEGGPKKSSKKRIVSTSIHKSSLSVAEILKDWKNSMTSISTDEISSNIDVNSVDHSEVNLDFNGNIDDSYYSEDEEEVYDDYFPSSSGHNSSQQSASALDFGKRINLSARVMNDIVKSEKKSERIPNYIGKDDRATSEQVLDPRTRLILFKLLSNGFLTEIDGCLSTGKEANVYFARGGSTDVNGIPRHYALKIFKTSILVFKDRDRYVSGEFRFRNGYCKSNPRRMVRTWAEKEMRNLKRLVTNGIPCPTPHLLKAHILIMDFLGSGEGDCWCAPRLKDVSLSEEQLTMCYLSIMAMVRRMYRDCNLVHGDLSEYNILWYKESPYIIDVSQSVEQSHPSASDFLRKDIRNVTEFFGKKGLKVLANYRVYQFVISTDKNSPSFAPETDAAIYQASLVDELKELLAQDELEEVVDEADIEGTLQDVDEEREEDEGDDEVEEAVFMRSHIPTSLNEIMNPYSENHRLQTGQREKAYAKAIQSMLVADDSTSEEVDEDKDESSDESSDEEGEGDDDDENDEDEEWTEDVEKYRRHLPPRDDTEARLLEKEARKAAKKLVKEQQAERRKKKMPKHLKKRAVQAGKKKK